MKAPRPSPLFISSASSSFSSTPSSSHASAQAQLNSFKPRMDKRVWNFLVNPWILAPLAFLAGGFWVQTILSTTNSQKSRSSLFKHIVLDLSHNPWVTSRLQAASDGLEYDAGTGGRVRGNVNHIKGEADLSFKIRAISPKPSLTSSSKSSSSSVNPAVEKEAGVKFVGRRYRDTDCWEADEYTVKIGDETLDILSLNQK